MLDPTPYRKLFPITDRIAHFNHAGVSPLSTRVVADMNEFNQRAAELTIGELRQETTDRQNELRQLFESIWHRSEADPEFRRLSL